MTKKHLDGSLKDNNQHFVTKAHLDAFVHPKSNNDVLHPYRRGGRRCRARGTSVLGSDLNFYRQRENGELNDKLDEARTELEKKLFNNKLQSRSALSKCVNDDTFNPTREDAVELAVAAAFLFCSSPAQIHNTAMVGLFAHQWYLFNQMNTKSAKEEYTERYGTDWENRLVEDREKILKGELFVDVGEENYKQLGFEAFNHLESGINLLLGMRMTIVDCDSRCQFITSDNPVVRIYESILHKKDDEVWFPISYKRAIWWHRREHSGRLPLKYSQCFVRNRQVIKHAHKFVYAPLHHDWIELAAKDQSFSPLLGHYGSLEKVISHAKPAIDQNGKPIGEIVNWMDALRAGERQEVLGL